MGFSSPTSVMTAPNSWVDIMYYVNTFFTETYKFAKRWQNQWEWFLVYTMKPPVSTTQEKLNFDIFFLVFLEKYSFVYYYTFSGAPLTNTSKWGAPFFLAMTVIRWTAESKGYVFKQAISKLDGADLKWPPCRGPLGGETYKNDVPFIRKFVFGFYFS